VKLKLKITVTVLFSFLTVHSLIVLQHQDTFDMLHNHPCNRCCCCSHHNAIIAGICKFEPITATAIVHINIHDADGYADVLL